MRPTGPAALHQPRRAGPSSTTLPWRRPRRQHGCRRRDPGGHGRTGRRRPTTGAAAYGIAGQDASAYDINTASNTSLALVVPAVLVLILILLALLLRSLVAPWYLALTVGLSYLASLGFAMIVFVHLGGNDGLIFVLPLLMFVFSMALGEDYNILLMSRIREEAHHAPSLSAALTRAIGITGGTVTSAGIILAGTFAVLGMAGGQERCPGTRLQHRLRRAPGHVLRAHPARPLDRHAARPLELVALRAVQAHGRLAARLTRRPARRAGAPSPAAGGTTPRALPDGTCQEHVHTSARGDIYSSGLLSKAGVYGWGHRDGGSPGWPERAADRAGRRSAPGADRGRGRHHPQHPLR